MDKFKQAGIGLLEVTIALGLAGVLVIVLMKLGEQQNKQQKKAMNDIELTEVYNQFVTMYNSQTACDATFGTAKLGDEIEEFRTTTLDPSQASFADIGKAFQMTKIKISSMKIMDNTEIQNLITTGNFPSLQPTVVTSSPFGHAMIQFRVVFDRGSQAAIKDIAKTFTIPVVMAQYQQPSGAMPYDAKENCKALGGVIADDDMETNGAGYQDSAVQTPANYNGSHWEIHCLIVKDNIPVSNMEVIKCRASKS